MTAPKANNNTPRWLADLGKPVGVAHLLDPKLADPDTLLDVIESDLTTPTARQLATDQLERRMDGLLDRWAGLSIRVRDWYRLHYRASDGLS